LLKKAESLLKISSIYLGTVLGAGFASGQEHLLFFVRFSKRGFVGCLLAGFLFSFLGGLILEKSYELSEKSHRKYLELVLGRNVTRIVATLTEIFLCISFCIMLSGAGAFFSERLGVPSYMGVLLTDLVCLFVFMFDMRGVSALNLLLTPIMLFGTIYVCIYTLVTESMPVWQVQVHPHGIFLPYAVFYVGYNMLTAISVLVPAASLATDKKTAIWGGRLGGLLLSVLAALCCLALSAVPSVHEKALPMLSLSERAGTFAHIVYSAVIFMAMLTTAVSSGFAVQRRLTSFGVHPKTAAIIICLISIPLSLVEFSVLIEKFYVAFGVLGVGIIGGIIWSWYKNKE